MESAPNPWTGPRAINAIAPRSGTVLDGGGIVRIDADFVNVALLLELRGSHSRLPNTPCMPAAKTIL